MKDNATKPFDDIRNLVSTMPNHEAKNDTDLSGGVEAGKTDLKPIGRLDKIVSWLEMWQGPALGQETVTITQPMVCVFVGTHKVAEFVSGSDPVAQAKKRVEMLSSGQAALRGIATSQGAAYKIYEMGIEKPAGDMQIEASLSEIECARAIAFGMEVVSEGADLIIIGNAGIGTATAAAGITRGLYGGAAQYWAGGQGAAAQRRIEAVGIATHFHKDILTDPLQVLRCFGGRDIAGMVGAILAARHQNIPVLLDGYAVCSAAAILHALNPLALDHCLAAHITVEPAHGALLDRIGKPPLLDLGLGIGDGSGAALAIGLIKAAAAGAETLST